MAREKENNRLEWVEIDPRLLGAGIVDDTCPCSAVDGGPSGYRSEYEPGEALVLYRQSERVGNDFNEFDIGTLNGEPCILSPQDDDDAVFPVPKGFVYQMVARDVDGKFVGLKVMAAVPTEAEAERRRQEAYR